MEAWRAVEAGLEAAHKQAEQASRLAGELAEARQCLLARASSGTALAAGRRQQPTARQAVAGRPVRRSNSQEEAHGHGGRDTEGPAPSGRRLRSAAAPPATASGSGGGVAAAVRGSRISTAARGDGGSKADLATEEEEDDGAGTDDNDDFVTAQPGAQGKPKPGRGRPVRAASQRGVAAAPSAGACEALGRRRRPDCASGAGGLAPSSSPSKTGDGASPAVSPEQDGDDDDDVEYQPSPSTSPAAKRRRSPAPGSAPTTTKRSRAAEPADDGAQGRQAGVAAAAGQGGPGAPGLRNGMCQCPMCQTVLPERQLESHIGLCMARASMGPRRGPAAAAAAARPPSGPSVQVPARQQAGGGQHQQHQPPTAAAAAQHRSNGGLPAPEGGDGSSAPASRRSSPAAPAPAPYKVPRALAFHVIKDKDLKKKMQVGGGLTVTVCARCSAARSLPAGSLCCAPHFTSSLVLCPRVDSAGLHTLG